MLREAEGQIGALTDVIGGTCVVSNLCPAKFACIGCSGNAPDPDRRYQIQTKKEWATQQFEWSRAQGLFAEQRQMKQIQNDCDQILEEMDPRGWADIWRANAVSEPVPAEKIAAVTQPISLVVGTDDAAGVLALSVCMHELLRTSRLQYVPGPHMIHLERPRSLSSAIDHHFTWLRV